jgi:hypothetical protein
MATKVEQVFKATDGETFKTKAAAERHSAVVDAARELEEACNKVRIALGKKALTADGQPFTMTYGEYWRVVPSWAGKPTLQSLTIYARHMSVDVERERVLIREYDHQRKDYIQYEIGELYADEREAKKALAVALREHIADAQAELDKLPSNP